jgi:hypothetical protein
MGTAMCCPRVVLLTAATAASDSLTIDVPANCADECDA